MRPCPRRFDGLFDYPGERAQRQNVQGFILHLRRGGGRQMVYAHDRVHLIAVGRGGEQAVGDGGGKLLVSEKHARLRGRGLGAGALGLLERLAFAHHFRSRHDGERYIGGILPA